MGIYGSAKNTIAYKGTAYADIRGEDIISLSSNVYECYSVYEMAVGLSTTDNTQTWSSLYYVINEVNTFLENIESNRAVVGDLYNQYVSEAKFLRALSFYYLNKLYALPYKLGADSKSIPLRLKAVNSPDDNNLACSTVSAVFEQILSDVSEDNLLSLPKANKSYEGITRATQAAARVLKQRVYLEKEDWKNAILQGEAIAGYNLLGSLSQVFDNNINAEVIFSFPMSDTNKGTDQTALAYYYSTGNIFILDDVLGYYSIPEYALPYDTRISDLTTEKDSKFLLRKFKDSNTYLDWVPIFRYAEVKLNLAEAYYNDNQVGKAKQALKDVRHRSIPEEKDLLVIDELQGDKLIKAIYNERRAEFVGEGLRSIDIHRRGEAFNKRNGVYQPTDGGYIWPIPTSERIVNNLIE